MQLHRKEIDPLFDAFPGIETERLSLRRLVVGDAPALFDMLSHSDVARFTARKPLAQVSDAVDLLRGVGLEYATRRSIRWGVTLLGEDKIMATVGLHDWDRYHRHISIGFDVAFEQWGNGYGSEMVAAICAYAFDHLSVHRVEAHIMKGNRGSKKMLEGIGFEIEGVLRKRMYKDGHQHDTQLFSLVAHKEDWMH